MKTIINIGTDKGNITGVEIDKPFADITYKDIKAIIEDIKGVGWLTHNRVQGWANVTPKKKKP